jgi:hypothetical protein
VTAEERNARRKESKRRTALRAQGYSIPFQRKGAPVTTAVRCPVCHEIISALKDCKCP